ncbi:MAG: cation diffusion facilitator family transporter [Bacillaceae bacterium]
MEKQNEVADRGAWISIIAYIVLSTIKITIGVMSDSEALRADGFNNLTDIISSVAVLIGLKLSRRPADEDHSYGHGRIEQIASLVAAFVMITVGVQVISEAIKSFIFQKESTPELIAAFTALFSAGVMIVVYLYNNKLAKRLNNIAMKAVAKDNLSDALVSIGAFIGIIGANMGIGLLDSVTAFLVGVIILKTAWDIFKESAHMLTDGFHPEKLEEYRKSLEEVDGVKEIRELRGRFYGNRAYVDVVIGVNGSIDTAESHHIADKVEIILKEKFHVLETSVHIEPI